MKGISKITTLASKPEYKEKISEALSGLGFHEILYNNNAFNANKDYFKKLTISIYPNIHEGETSSERLTDLAGLRGYGSYRRVMRYFYHSSDNNIKYGNVASSSDYIIARYYKDRNLLLFFYPVFDNLNFDIPLAENACLEKVLAIITDICKNNKVEQVKVDVEKILVDNFMSGYTLKLGEIRNNLVGNTRNISEYEKSIIDLYRSILIMNEQEKKITEFIANGKEELAKQIAEIRKHPFVKSVEITSAELQVNVDMVSIEVGGKPVEIGEMIFSISPEHINIDCVERKKYWSGTEWRELIHPHIVGTETSRICFGERGEIVHELLGKFELGKLVYMLYLWAKSYNPSDKYNAIGYWTGELGLHPDEIARREREARGESATPVSSAFDYVARTGERIVGYDNLILQEDEDNEEEGDNYGFY